MEKLDFFHRTVPIKCRHAELSLVDIRLWNMPAFWRDVPLPKLDLTSFGHWSGTGVGQWPAQ